MDKKCIVIVILLLVVAILGNILYSKRENKELVIPHIDTIPFYMPVLRDSVVIRYDVVKLPISDRDTIHQRDTIYRTDSVYVTIPITQKIYEDSLFKAYISGYNPTLDSITIYNRKTVLSTPKERRWGLGVHAGYGVSNHGLTPYIGIGISYNLIRW